MGRKYDFELLLVRHGDAEDWADGGDAQRALTPAGRQALERCLPAWRHFGWQWSKAITSPFVRARQTAEIFHAGLAREVLEREGTDLLAPVEDDRFTPSSNPVAAARALIEIGNKQAGPRPRVVVFAHNPLLSRLAGLLLASPSEPVQLSLGRGDVLHLFVPAPSPFDLILDPLEEEPLPRAILLGFYPRALVEQVRPRDGGE